MKFVKIIVSFLILPFFPDNSSGQTVVHGTLSSPSKKFKINKYTDFFYTAHFSDGSGIQSSMPVHFNGQFDKEFPFNTTIEFDTFIEDFYNSDTTIFTDSLDSVEVHFIIHPKKYIYTYERAKSDIQYGIVQLITFDSSLYNWNQRIDFSDQFGFSYLLLPEPQDYDFRTNYRNYNGRVSKYLNLINDTKWREELHKIEDSLIHFEIDNYGKTHDIPLNKLRVPEEDELSETSLPWVVKWQQKEYYKLWGDSGDYARLTPEDILHKIDHDSSCYYKIVAIYWVTLHYRTLIPELIKRITDNREVGLIHTTDLIIWERLESGDLEWQGHGYIVEDDLFTVAGRANYLLRKVTGEDFGHVSMKSTHYDLKKLQNRWAYWLMNLGQ